MLKRNLALISLSSFLTFPALAHEISFGAGALSVYSLTEITYTDTTLGSPTPSFVWDPSGNDITGEVYLGYAYNVNKGFDIAAEIFYDFTGPTIDQYVDYQSYIETSTSGILGVRILPGFNFTASTRVFFDVGYLFIQNQISTKNLADAADFEVVSNSSSTTSQWSGALQYGVGLETMFYKNFGLRASYSVTPAYDPKSNEGGQVTSIDETQTYTVRPSYYQFYLGAILRFSF